MSIFSAKLTQRTSHEGDLGIGMISVFALIVILCMAVLSVLAFSTAHSSLVLSQRQASSTQELYLNETAAQTFIAGLGGQANLDALCDEAEAATDGAVSATATAGGDTVQAEFTCAGGRTLSIEVTVQPDGSVRVDSWRMTAVEAEEQPIGTLYSVDNT